MGQTALPGKVVTGNKNCEWIYRFWAKPGGPWGGIVPPSPVLTPGSALGWRPRVARSSAQAFIHRTAAGRVRQSSRRVPMVGRLASQAALLLSRAPSSIRFRWAKMRGSRPASLAAGVILPITLCRRTSLWCATYSATSRQRKRHSGKCVRNRFLTRVLSVDSLCAMGRPRRADDGGLIYHVLNRAKRGRRSSRKTGTTRPSSVFWKRLSIAREQGCWPTVSCPTTGT